MDVSYSQGGSTLFTILINIQTFARCYKSFCVCLSNYSNDINLRLLQSILNKARLQDDITLSASYEFRMYFLIV